MRPVKHSIDTTLLRVEPIGGNRNNITEGSEWNTPPGFDAASMIGFFLNEQEINLTGMAVQHKTFYPESFNIQSGPVRYVSPGTQGAGALIEMHWVQTKPFDFRDYLTLADVEQFTLLPGLLGTTTSFDQVICGEWTTYTSSTSQTPALECYPSSSGRFGSMNPVATDRLYYYRFVIANLVEVNANAYGVPATRFELFGQEGEPADLDYIMQLRRNAELQQSYDED